MGEIERAVAREARAMTRKEVILKATQGQITWIQAATIAGISDRQMRRLKRRYEHVGFDAFQDYLGRVPRRKRIPMETIARICQLKRDDYGDFSVKHFHEQLTEQHGVLAVSYQGRELARFTADGDLIKHRRSPRRAA